MLVAAGRRSVRRSVKMLASTRLPAARAFAGGRGTKEFLDSEQYATREIMKYEWCFGEGFMSAGGIDTTREFVQMLDLKPGMRVLDVGCGVGGSALHMASEYGADVLGIDLGDHTLNVARQRAMLRDPACAGEVAFEWSNVTEADWGAGTFDVIYSRDMLLHIPYEQKLPLFAKFHSWLKPGGQLLLSDYGRGGDGAPPSEALQQWMAKRQYALLTLKEYQTLCEDAGFAPSAIDAQDRSWEYCQVSRAERRRLEGRRDAFVAEYSQEEMEELVDVFESKISMCVDGDRSFQLVHARKQQRAGEPEAEAALRSELCAINHRVAESGLVCGTDGNSSVRIPGTDMCLIKPSGVAYEDLLPEHMVALNYETGEVAAGQLKPSSEWHFHTQIYKQRPDVNSVVHTHSMFATALSCARMPVPAFHYSVTEVGERDFIACTPYHTYGTPELAQSVIEALGEGSESNLQQVALIANHGAVAVGSDLEEAFYFAKRCENLCELYWRTLSVPGANLLTAEEMAGSRSRDQSYGQLEGGGESQEQGSAPDLSTNLRALQYSPSGGLSVLDQLLLPLTTKFVDIRSAEDAREAIVAMKVRGAPLIAIVAALAIAVEARSTAAGGATSAVAAAEWLHEKTAALRASRPTAVNLFEAMDRLDAVATEASRSSAADADQVIQQFVSVAEGMLVADVADNVAIGEHGADSIVSMSKGTSGLRLLTICNTGALATAGHGTALGIVRTLYSRGALERCYALETRPYNQGSRLTAFELVSEGIPGTLLCDSMAASLLREAKIDAVVVGADRVAANGDTANKIGTYQLAVLAKEHGVPFYVAAPSTSIDLTTLSGRDIVVEQRPASELTTMAGVQIAPDGIDVWNPSFDVTPNALVTGIVTEHGTIEKQHGAFDLSSLKN